MENVLVSQAMIKSSRSRFSAKLKAKAGDTDRDLDYSRYHRKQI